MIAEVLFLLILLTAALEFSLKFEVSIAVLKAAPIPTPTAPPKTKFLSLTKGFALLLFRLLDSPG